MNDTAMYAKSHRTLVAALMAAPFLIFVAVAAVLGSAASPLKPTTGLLVVVVLAAVIFVVVPKVLTTAPPLQPGESAIVRHQSITMLRFALCESVMLVSVALSFVQREGGMAVVFAGMVASEILFYTYLWPTRSTTRALEAHLESNGVDAGLTEAFFPNG